MKATILSIGTELLFGQIVNTNAAYISAQLQMLGIDVMYQHTVGDNPKRLKEVIRESLKETDMIIATGGLGPTQDDLTKETIAAAMGDELVINKDIEEKIRGFFKKNKRVMTENNLKQAYLPKHGRPFYNNEGTAPGFALEKDEKVVIALPGPPREMKSMFEQSVLPYIQEKSDSVIYYRLLRLFGIGESALETALEDLINKQSDPTLATYAKEGECSLRIASKRKSKAEAIDAVLAMIEEVRDIVGEYIYSEDDEDYPEVVGKKLIDKNLTISSAESCTGGLFAKSLTDIPGISQVFNRGYVTYSNQAKIEELAVSSETLEEYGAVSSQVAEEMAVGARKNSDTDLAVSVTGIAGPDGGTEEKPVGLAYICVSVSEKNHVKKIQVRNVNREWNRNYIMLAMFDLINKIISEK